MVMFSKISMYLAVTGVMMAYAMPAPQNVPAVSGTPVQSLAPVTSGTINLNSGPLGFINSVNVYGNNTSPDGRMLGADTTPADLDQYKNTFLFTNSQYFGLQQYVYNGLGLAGTKEMFEAQYDRAAFTNALGVIKAGLYDECENVFVSIHTHCGDFMTTTLGEMSKFAGETANSAKYFQDSYNEMVLALTNMPPAVDGKIDQATHDQLLGSLSNLKGDLSDAKTTTERVQKELVQFQTDTASDRGALAKAIKDLEDADPEVKNKMSNSKQQMDVIQQQINQSIKDVNSAIDSLNNGVYYCWIWPIGTIVWLAMKPQFENERDTALQKEKEEIEELNHKQAELASVSGVYTSMGNIERSLEAVQQWVDAAVDQIGGAAKAFQTMETDVERIEHDLTRAITNIDPSRYWVSTSFKNQLDDASKMWAEVAKVATAFRDGPAPQNITVQEALIKQTNEPVTHLDSVRTDMIKPVPATSGGN